MKNVRYNTIYISWFLFVITILFVHFRPAVKDTPLKKPLLYFPYEIDRFKGSEKAISDSVLTLLKADDLLIRDYKSDAREVLELYCGYFEHVEKEKTPHVPQYCWVGSGWVFRSLGNDVINIKSKVVNISKILAEKESVKTLLFYCYRINNKYTGDISKFRILAILDSVFKRKSGAFTLQLSSELGEEKLEDKEKVMKDFLIKVLTILEDEFLP